MTVREHSPLWRRVLRTGGRLLFRWAENNDNPRFETNGEAWLLRRVFARHARSAGGRPFVLIDAGANRGDYTRTALAFAREAGIALELHVFEPSPVCAAALQQEFGAVKGVTLNIAAVGEHDGEAALHDGATGSSQASLVVRDSEVAERTGTAAICVRVRRLEQYLVGRITKVDLLKLDVEGFEVPALRGLGAALNPAVVDLIQFEYGGASLDAGTSLRDAFRVLEAAGYTVAKLMPRSLEVRSYRAWMEHYAYANYVAVSPRWRTGAAHS